MSLRGDQLTEPEAGASAAAAGLYSLRSPSQTSRLFGRQSLCSANPFGKIRLPCRQNAGCLPLYRRLRHINATCLVLDGAAIDRTIPAFRDCEVRTRVSFQRRMIDEKSRLLEQAERCRLIAQSTTRPETVAMLLCLARSYEAKAAQLSAWDAALHRT